jgi:pimeloyl-ACP methyl ester carboxylesterase
MFIETPHSKAILHSVGLGPGPRTVLALNGWSATWQAWAPTFELLSRRLRCISFDTRGTGGSTGAPESVTLENLAADALAVLDAHGVERCILAGESLGGFIAMHLAAGNPDRVSALALVATPIQVTREHTAPLTVGARSNYPATVDAFVAQCLPGDPAETLHHWGVHLFDQASPEVAARLFECCQDVAIDLSSIRQPTTIIHSKDDTIVPLASGRAIAAGIVGANMVELDAAGHAPTVTHPAVVAAEILRLAGDHPQIDGNAAHET